MSGGCGGSGAASPLAPSGEGGFGEWRRIYDRVKALLPRVEALAAERVRLGTQQELSEARENSLHARLLQAEASRSRWKTAYKKQSYVSDASSLSFERMTWWIPKHVKVCMTLVTLSSRRYDKRIA